MANVQSNLSDEVLTILRQIIRATDMHSKRLSRDTGLTTAQYVVLRSLKELGEVTMRTLSAHVSLSQATLTTIIDRLEKRELVERYRSVTDRRIVHARLSKEGTRMLKKAPPLLQDEFTDSFNKLKRSQQKEIIESLRLVANMMGAQKIDASPVLTVAPPTS